MRREQTEKGIRLYQAAIQKSPSQVKAYEALGNVYKKQKEYDKAIATWRNYFKYDNQTLCSVALKNAIGDIYLEKKEYEKAYAVV